MQRYERRCDSEMREQFTRMPRVFGRNHANLFEYSHRAWREILEIADRRRDDVQQSRPAGFMV
jgi:IS4 transposase